MARKVFISVLGAGFYDACKYTKGSFVSSETRFIQQATLEYLKVKEKWTTMNEEGEVVDRVVILLTDGAKGTNWNKSITKRLNSKTGTEVMYNGLEQVLQDMNLPCPVETVSIPDGKSEDEMWTIFNDVFETLQNEDELYFDLTHSYRYLPMLVLVLGNYAKFLKGVKVKHVSYGNYEARNDSNEAPMMDILPLTMLQDWTFAAADLIRNGNLQRLQELTQEQALSPMLRTRGRRNIERATVEQPLSRYVEALKDMLTDMKLCLGPNILNGQSVNAVNDQYENVTNHYSDLVAPIRPIIDTIQDTFKTFLRTTELDPLEIQNGYEAARWCYEHQLYQQAVTILDENITTHFCQRLGTDERVYEQRAASNAFLRFGEYREKDWESEHFDGVRDKVYAAASYPDVQEFITLMRWDVVWIHNNCRNKYNHASMIQGAEGMLTPTDIEKLGRIIEKIIGRIR